MLAVQPRLGIERIHLRDAAIHVKKNDAANFGVILRNFCREWNAGDWTRDGNVI